MQTRPSLFILAVAVFAPALAGALPLPPVESAQVMTARDFRAAVDAEKAYIRDNIHSEYYSIYLGLRDQPCLYVNPATPNRAVAVARMEFYVRRQAYVSALRQAQHAQRLLDTHRESSALLGITADAEFEQSQQRTLAAALLATDRAAAAALGAREAYQVLGGDMDALALNESEFAARTADYRASGCPRYD